MSHSGTALLRELADDTGLTGEFSSVLRGLQSRRGDHDPGQIAVDLAVMIVDGGQVISDLRTLSDQELLHGPVASTATAWRVLDYLASTTGDPARRTAPKHSSSTLDVCRGCTTTILADYVPIVLVMFECGYYLFMGIYIGGRVHLEDNSINVSCKWIWGLVSVAHGQTPVAADQ